MNKSSLILPLLLCLLGWLIFGSFYCKSALCGAGAGAAAVIPAATSCSAWSINDGSKFSANSNKFYRFVKNQSNVLPARSAGFKTAIAGTVNHLKTNKDRQLVVTGHYFDDETKPSNFANMGFARANSVKNSLVKMGVPASQIDMKSMISKSNHYHGDTLCQGVDFAFRGMAAPAVVAPTRIDKIKKNIVGKNVILYFPTNGDDISLSAKAKQDIADIKYYLDNVPGSSIEVAGHTDNQGNSDYNKDLSKRRANDAAQYLKRTAGFDTKRMNITGYGEEKPVADNNRTEGRKKNRRVEITLKG